MNYMNFRNVFRVLGIIYISIGLILFIPLSISIVNNDGAQIAFLVTVIISLISGILFNILKTEKPDIEKKEAIAIVVIGWASVSVLGAFPFYFSGYFPGFLDSLFESVSGFTTTGASILKDIESLPLSILFWRSLTHWLGGMGIIIFVLIVLPVVNIGTRNLYNFESSSIAQERLTPKVKDTARLLWFVYFFFTLAETILLMAGGLPFFDALLTSFGTIPTGGFSPKNMSVAGYNSVYVEIVVMVFMVLSGINFSFYLRALLRPEKK
ncbi:MAG: TrkH family potassium uptake protein, partial [Candidatus Neomarinimicrobiota bacterium]